MRLIAYLASTDVNAAGKMLWIRQNSICASLAQTLTMNMVDYGHGDPDLLSKTYSTEEAAEKLGISKSTILRWLKKGYDKKVRRDRNGWRVFTAADVKAIKKDMGL